MTDNNTARRFFDYVGEKLKTLDTECDNIERGAQLLFDSHRAGGNFYVLAEELFERAGGYAPVRAILPPEMMLHEMPNKSTQLERLSGYADAMLKLYGVGKNDVILIISNSGRNAVPVEMAALAKQRGCAVIAITSLTHSAKVTPRNSLGKRLFEVADVALDNKSVPGDAGFTVEGLPTPMGPTSTVTGAALAQALVIAFVDKLVRAGEEPEVFRSSNLDGADEYNEKLFAKYC